MQWNKELKMGFSVNGFLVVLVAMLPNVFFLLLDNSTSTIAIIDKYAILGMLESTFRVFMIIGLIAIKSKTTITIKNKYAVAMLTCLVLYLFIWGIYFVNGMDYSLFSESMILSALMALIPSAYFIFASLWLKNNWAVLASSIFGIIHILNTCVNLI